MIYFCHFWCSIPSDGGPKFVAELTKKFYSDEVHRMSSAYHPYSNDSAELPVKSTKRLVRRMFADMVSYRMTKWYMHYSLR